MDQQKNIDCTNGRFFAKIIFEYSGEYHGRPRFPPKAGIISCIYAFFENTKINYFPQITTNICVIC